MYEGGKEEERQVPLHHDSVVANAPLEKIWDEEMKGVNFFI